MPLPLPNLDTRRWADLVDEGRALIPRHAPEWTDHNVHDPGVMLVELFAWLAEQLMYRANRVPERHLRKFLALAGHAPRPPVPAAVVLALRPPLGGAVAVPAGASWSADVGDGRSLPFRATEAVALVEAQLAAGQAFDGARFADVSRPLRDGLPFPPLGADPRAPSPYATDGAPALYLGFDRALPANVQLSLYLHVEGAREGERARLLAEAAAVAAECERTPPGCTPCERSPDVWCGDAPADGVPLPGAGAANATLPPHHSARTAWEFLAADGWHVLDEGAGEATDETRALTLPGRVRLRLPSPTVARAVGTIGVPRHWLRCRLLAGAYDETPVLLGVTVNAVVAEQAGQAWERFAVAPGVVAGGPLAPGALVRLTLAFDARGTVQAVGPAPPNGGAPEVRVVDFAAAGPATAGALALDLVRLGEGTDFPDQEFTLPIAPVARGQVATYTVEPTGAPTGWRRWEARADLDASGPSDAHLALDPAAGKLRFGDGVRGRVPAAGATVLAAYAATAAGAGSVAAGRAWTLVDDALGRAIAGADFAALALVPASNPQPAAGGADAESVGAAAARAAGALWPHERLVELCPLGTCDTLDQLDRAAVLARPAPERAATTLDVERVALDVPGTRVRRARAWTELDPAHPGVTVPGTVALVVVPALPAGRPAPTPGLVRAVRRHLDRRRVLCTRLVVVGPTYLDVFVRASVGARRGADPARVRRDVEHALAAFLDPLAGGPAGRGWPFGRDVYRSEVLQVVDAVPGVDHVRALTLAGGGEEAACGNLCVPPTWLVASAGSAVTVEEAP